MWRGSLSRSSTNPRSFMAWDQDRRLLLAASILHEIGTFLGHKKHHKHPLPHLQLRAPGLSPTRCSWWRISPDTTGRIFPGTTIRSSCASPKQTRRGPRFFRILRVADALDRSHLQNVEELKVRWGKKEIPFI